MQEYTLLSVYLLIFINIPYRRTNAVRITKDIMVDRSRRQSRDKRHYGSATTFL